MHELSLMCAVLDAVAEQAGRDGFTRVHRVRLELGELCCVEPEALRFCFELVAEGTVAADATLDVRVAAGRDHEIVVTELEVE